MLKKYLIKISCLYLRITFNKASMKTIKEIETLHEKAQCLLELANDMNNRIDGLREIENFTGGFIQVNHERVATCERGYKRIMESYKRVLTEIMESI